MAKHYFHVGDFIVFGLTVVISIAIGIYYALSGGRQKTTAEFLVGGRTMSFLPVAVSLLVSFESSIMMLGLPAETYVYGIQYLMGSVGLVTAMLLNVHIVVPMLHPLKITSAYEYLELRFQSRAVRYLGTIMGMLTYTWYMGIVLFGPAVALEAVTDFPLWSSIFVISFVSVIYTSIGGLKAVVWTDVFQAVIMLAGVLAILIKGTSDVGGPKKVWDIAERGGRFNFFNFDPDPRTRHTFWCLFSGAAIRGFSLGFNQSTVQRISSTRTLAEAKRMLTIVAPCLVFSLFLAQYEGIVAFSYYTVKRCDPFESKQINDPNQIIPYFVMDIFEGLPGMPGLFLASLFSASLSTLSSGLSSLSALLWADIVQPLVGPHLSETRATIVAKGSVVLFGILACAVAILVAQIGGTLTQIAGSLVAAFNGPLTGLFFLGSFFPRVKANGALFGGVIGLVFSFWLSLGIVFSPSVKPTPWMSPAPTDSCPLNGATGVNVSELWGNVTVVGDGYSNVYNFSNLSLDHSTVGVSPLDSRGEPEGIEKLYTLSYQWIAVLGTLSTVVLALIYSLFTGTNKPGDVDPRYLIGMSGTFLICWPKKIQDYVGSLGPQYIREEYKTRFPDPAKFFELKGTELEVKVMMDNRTQDYDNMTNGHLLLDQSLLSDSVKPEQNGGHTDESRDSPDDRSSKMRQ
ncbi:unnamed protein product [Lymnaea stagnalis]|uniref:Sodium-coupled monocarboxylate transporter 1 n=1 Tax=Lymnaea stagnalis TaxID=6523 RepID=A0AAV2INB3_LYMST